MSVGVTDDALRPGDSYAGPSLSPKPEFLRHYSDLMVWRESEILDANSS